MSEPRLVSPLLDGFVIGEPMSDHHGVRCCPAIREDTDERYIVKIISIPASQLQLDALLLSGAYSGTAEALAYFKELSEGVIGESDILSRLSRLEGFLPYTGYQTVQMEDGIGYEIYLLSPYKRTLEKQMCTAPLTQLDAVNLGLDMCAALAVARRAGYLYINLKPGNIFYTDTQGFRIGDLGFLPMASLKYASLPEKYRSSYTAPEIVDAMSTLNDTLDIYALGLTLYQVYNNGELPFEGSAPAESLPPPLYADYEMAEIILKACTPDPAARWQDPAQMGQALVNYMQRNSVNAVPIVPPPVEMPQEPEEAEDFLSEDENEAALAALLEELPEEEPPAEEPTDPTGSDESDGTPEDPGDSEDITFIEEETDETLPSEEDAAELEDAPVSDEVAEMLAQADELISHELPEPVVEPEAIDVPIPPPIVPEPEAEEESEEVPTEEETGASEEESPSESPSEEETEEPAESDPAETDEDEEEEHHHTHARKKRKLGPWIAAAVSLVLIAALIFGGQIFYREYYLQTVESITIDGSRDYMTVTVNSDIDDDLLTVICIDTYGNTQRSPVKDGVARFVNLNPSTQYRIHTEISGLHKLLGNTTGTYTTAQQTEVLNFTAISGPEDGSVILNFTVVGPEEGGWSVEYTAGGTAPETQDFTGHSVTITGLNVGREYIFRLIPKGDLYLAGDYTLTFTPRNIIYAQDLAITQWDGSTLVAQWTIPEGTSEQTWSIRCYNDAGFDQTVTTQTNTAHFDGLDASTGYTIKVTADGMTQGVTATVTANPINVTGFIAGTSDKGTLDVSWTFTGQAPAGGWILTYTIDGSAPQTVTCADPNASLPLYHGSHYEFTLQSADAVTFFSEVYTCDTPDPAPFEGYLVSAADMDFYLCKTPDKEKWDRHDLKDSDYKTTFAVGEKASFLVYVREKYNTSDDIINITFIVRDAEGKPVSRNVTSSTWTKLWYKHYCELDIPQMPTTAGKYTIEVYFNDLYVTTEPFSIT